MCFPQRAQSPSNPRFIRFIFQIIYFYPLFKFFYLLHIFSLCMFWQLRTKSSYVLQHVGTSKQITEFVEDEKNFVDLDCSCHTTNLELRVSVIFSGFVFEWVCVTRLKFCKMIRRYFVKSCAN